MCSSDPTCRHETPALHLVCHLGSQRQLRLHRHDDSFAAMQTTQSDMGTVSRHLFQPGNYCSHLILRHGMLNHDRSCLRGHAVCHIVEAADEKKTQVYSGCYAESRLLVGIILMVENSH